MPCQKKIFLRKQVLHLNRTQIALKVSIFKRIFNKNKFAKKNYIGLIMSVYLNKKKLTNLFYYFYFKILNLYNKPLYFYWFSN